MIIQFVSLARDFWGAEESFTLIATGLVRLGHVPRLVTFSSSAAESWRHRVNNQVVVCRGANRRFSRAQDIGRLVFSPRGYWADADAVVLFSHQASPVVPFLRLRDWVLRTGRVWSIEMHDALDSPGSRASLVFGAMASDVLFCVSQFSRDVQLPRIMRSRVLVLGTPVDATDTKSDGWREWTAGAPLRVGIVGRLDPEKRHEVLLEALTLTRIPHRGVVVGTHSGLSGSYESSLRTAFAARIPGRVEFRGRVPLGAVLDGLDVVVVCNDREPLGRTIIEAQYAGVPVLVPDRGGASELVADGATGWKYRAGSAPALAAALDRLSDHPSEAAAILGQARASALARFDVLTYCQKFTEGLATPGRASKSA